MELWITNDTLGEVEGNTTVRLRTFAGDSAWEENIHVWVAAIGSHPIRRWERDELVSSRPDHYLSVRSAEGLCAPNRHFFAAIDDLQRTPIRPEVIVTPGGDHELQIHLRASEYAYFVRLIMPDEAAHFRDNYLDLEPGESRTIVVAKERGSLAPETVTVGWR